MVGALTEAMDSLLASFRTRNKGAMPQTLVVYRDGVSEGQYDQVLQQELPQIQEAIALQGFTADSVRIAIVVCTKGHRTRIVCQEGPGGEYVNPCPGLVVDSVVTSENLNEFYLNSHAAIQGTAKPCRYTVLYDEVGFKMSELQLLTYWTTYLYARCNKSVSYATPAYYAHWASKRGKELLAAGATREVLRDICNTCAAHSTSPGHRDNNMFFL
jgi:eukaryotic translation initiation factor 2C